MKKLLIVVFTLSFIQLFGNKSQLELIKSEIQKSEDALVIKNRADQAILHALKAQQLYENWGTSNFQIAKIIQLKFIGAFQKMNHAEKAIIHLRKLQDLNFETDSFATINFYLNTSRLAGNFNKIELYDSAYTHFLKALESANQMNNNLYKSSASNNIGMHYANINNWEMANQYYDKAISILDLNDKEDSVFLRNILDNKANYYLHLGDTTKAIEIISNNLEYLDKSPENHQMIMRYSNKIINLYLNQGDINAAASRVKKALNFIPYGRKDWQLENSIKLSELKLEIERLKQNKRAELYVLKQLDSLRKQKIAFKEEQNWNISKTMNQYMAQAAERETNILQEQQHQIRIASQRKTILIIIAMAIGIVISILIKLSYKRKLAIQSSEQKLKEKELQISNLENEKLSKSLKNQSEDFSDLVMQISLKEDWSAELATELEHLCTGNKNVDVSQIKFLARSLKQRSSIHEKLELKQKGIKEVNNAFFERLEKKFSNLTRSEKELCALLKLKLDGKEIATIRNIAPASVRKLRHRLRKKMSLDISQDIYEVIDKI